MLLDIRVRRRAVEAPWVLSGGTFEPVDRCAAVAGEGEGRRRLIIDRRGQFRLRAPQWSERIHVARNRNYSLSDHRRRRPREPHIHHLRVLRLSSRVPSLGRFGMHRIWVDFDSISGVKRGIRLTKCHAGGGQSENGRHKAPRPSRNRLRQAIFLGGKKRIRHTTVAPAKFRWAYSTPCGLTFCSEVKREDRA